MSLPRNQRRQVAKQATKSATKSSKKEQPQQDRLLGIKESAINTLVQGLLEMPAKHANPMIQFLQNNLVIVDGQGDSKTDKSTSNE